MLKPGFLKRAGFGELSLTHGHITLLIIWFLPEPNKCRHLTLFLFHEKGGGFT